MKVRRVLAKVAVLVLLASGCGGPTGGVAASLVSGNFYEKTNENGQSVRFSATNLEGWKTYDANPRKGEGNAGVLKAEFTF